MAERQQERNEEIFQRYQRGESAGILARDFGLRRQRISQIVREIAGQNGYRLRGPEGCSSSLRVGSRRRYLIPESLRKLFQEKRMTMKEIAKELGCSPQTVRIQFLRDGLIEARKYQDRELTALLYREFMAGKLLRELAEEYGLTTVNVGERIFKYRRKHGLPGKYAGCQKRKKT